MNKSRLMLINIAISLLLIMIPVTVIGAIAENPIDFLGEIIFGEGDTTSVSDEVRELYNEFLKSDIGVQTLEYISNKNEGQETVYHSAYYTLPLLFVIEEGNGDATFESLKFQKKIDILYKLRYGNSEDLAYIGSVKNHAVFNKLSSLSDTTLMTYINYFTGSSDTGSYTVKGDSELGNAIAKKALLKLDCPYYWGASGPDYFDCSGLVYWTLKENGVNVSRLTANDYANMGQAVTKEQLMAGDVITFDYEKDGYADHIGIYIGNGKMVHASGEGATCLGNHASQGHVVKVADVLNSDYWNKVIYNYRRLY